MLKHLTDLAKGSWRYATGLRSFLAVTIDIEEAKAILATQLQGREEAFLRVLELGIYGNPGSPYRRLLLHAGFQFEDVRALIRQCGLEGALTKLYDSGVYVTLDEFKGRAPVRRPGLEFPVTAQDFDNPLLSSHYQDRTGGSRGGGTRVDIDFDHIAHEAAGTLLLLYANHLEGRPGVLRLAGPPSNTSLRSLFLQTRGGHIPAKWLSPGKPRWNRQGVQGRALTLYTLLVARLAGRPLPRPEYAPEAGDVVRHLVAFVRKGTPAVVVCSASEWVRICLAAEEMGADIRGTVFRSGGEPYTSGKTAVLDRVGARGVPNYTMHEAGNLSMGCGNPAVADDMHLMTDRVVVLQRPVQLDSGMEVGGLFHTSLLTSAPKLMLNIESGDYGIIEERDCGCLWQSAGLTRHIHTVRSYEKLTSGSVMFMGSMLHELLEETLPARFGGGPLDYQLIEEEEDGLPRVSLLVSPSVGPLDEAEVLAAAYERLSFSDWSRRMAEMWRKDGTLRVQRREPYATGARKILPLHVLNSTAAQKSRPG